MADEPETPPEEQTAETETIPEADPEIQETVMDAMTGSRKDDTGYNIDAMLNVGLNVEIVLGKTRMPISSLLKLSRGSIIELDKKIGEPVDVVINDRLVARGDLVKMAEDRVGVSLIEIVKDYVSDK
ncbi:flagellar motor switch protein FliN [Pseudooceanicola sp.]|uniref:flagellar motor switch protein FliN n=1 Tax=Pseudooceanicola sp. TaxID=1914328 RepID=UPI0035C6D01B